LLGENAATTLKAPTLRDPSATAELIAQGTLFLSQDALLRRFVPDGAAELTERFLSSSTPTKLTLTRLGTRPGLRNIVWGIESAVLPGILLHYALRKRYIEESARAFFDRGGNQLVVLGAGFDTLASRLAVVLPGVACIELDHPATQEKKRRALLGRTSTNLQLVPADLGSIGAVEALASAPLFSSNRPTFFVLEGVSMYLSESSVARTLAECARLGGAGTRVAWTFMTPDDRGRIAFRRSRAGLVNAWLSVKGEPFTWGIPRHSLEPFLSPLGLRVLEVVAADALRARYLTPLGIERPLAEGEECCLCEKT
jgi:methyltransferase (TIGR00027 family)